MSQRDTMKPFRKAVNDVINGFVTYKSALVKVYDKKIFTGDEPNLYIFYGSMRESDITATECTWETKTSLEILIVSQTGSEVSQDPLDEISDVIYDLVLNLPGSDNLGAQSGFQIVYVTRESATCGMMEISPTKSRLVKIITLTAKIIQQN